MDRATKLCGAIGRATDPKDLFAILRPLIRHVEAAEDRLRIVVDTMALAARLGIGLTGETQLSDPVIDGTFSARRRDRNRKLVFANATNDRDPDQTLISAIARARRWFTLLKDRQVESIADLAEKAAINRGWISSQLPLAFLAPDLVEKVVSGDHPPALNLDRLLAIAANSPDWDIQRKAFKGL